MALTRGLRMAAFDWRVGYEGSLLSLLREQLEPYLPARDVLATAQTWVLGRVEDKADVLPVRAFAGRRERGVPFAGGRFVPVDNEPLAELYSVWLGGTVRERASWRESFECGEIPISWCAADGAPFTARPAKTSFRERGILLAHLFDAANNVIGDDNEACSRRYVRSMNPANVVPWPGPRRTKQRIHGSFDVGAPRADLSSMPVVQEILAGWMAEHLGGLEDEAAQRWLVSVGGTVTDVMRRWESIAASLQVEIAPRSRKPDGGDGEGAAGAAIPPDGGRDADGGSGTRGALEFDGFIDKIDQFVAGARSTSSDTIRKSATLRATFFPPEHADFNVKYTLQSDSKVSAVERLVNAARSMRDEEEEWLFRPELTGGKHRLRFRAEEGVAGLYLYEVD